MKILLDFTQIPVEKVGVGVYALKTIDNLLKLSQFEHEYIILIQNDDKEVIDLLKQNNIKIKCVNASIFRRLLFRILLEQLYIPYLILKHKVDLVHSLHYSYPLFRFWAKCIVTIHDLTFFLYPEVHTKIKCYYFKTFIKWNAYSKNELICVSESTANDLISYFPSCKKRVHIIPLAVEDIPLISLSSVRKRLNIPSHYILFIGTLEPRKNLVSLIRAYSLITDKVELSLVIVGKKGWFYESIFDEVKQNNIEEKVYFTGFVTEEEKYALLGNCEVFIYPSLYEGFGLPVLEALKLAKPVITSNVSSMPEVAGNAALLVNPKSVSDISKALLMLITDEELKNNLKSKAKKQASFFSWEKTAKQTLD